MDTFEQLKKDCESCMRCALGIARNTLVFGDGNEIADILFVGEGPGEQEDLQGDVAFALDETFKKLQLAFERLGSAMVDIHHAEKAMENADEKETAKTQD